MMHNPVSVKKIVCEISKTALAKIFISKILCLKVDNTLWFVITYVILKQAQLISKTFPWIRNTAKTKYQQYIFACKKK